jgi:aminodeoxyfutalosine deaminase
MQAGGAPFPKIELHVHLEATVQPETLLAIARRNDVALPADTDEALRAFFAYRDFAHFIQVWIATTKALRTADDYRRITVDYAAEAKRHGAVYVEAIFSPAEPVRRGSSWVEVFEGVTAGVQEARELHGVELRLTPDIPRSFTQEEGRATVEWAVRYRDRGVVAVGIGGLEAEYPPELWTDVFAEARAGGLGSVPHAGEVAGPASIRGALDALQADRLRHGFRAVEDWALVDEIAARGVVLDVCPVSNVRTGVVAAIEEHPLAQLVERGVLCTLNTDDPVLFDTDLTREHEAAAALGLGAKQFYDAGVAGALCDAETRARLAAIGAAWDWDGAGTGTGATRGG